MQTNNGDAEKGEQTLFEGTYENWDGSLTVGLSQGSRPILERIGYCYVLQAYFDNLDYRQVIWHGPIYTHATIAKIDLLRPDIYNYYQVVANWNIDNFVWYVQLGT